MMAMNHALIGSWTLVSCEIATSSNDVLHPLGKDPVGYLIYGLDGLVSATLMSRDRAPFQGTDPAGGTPEELASAAHSFIGYVARYEILEDRVLHHVTASFFPNYLGTTLERRFELDGDELVLNGV